MKITDKYLFTAKDDLDAIENCLKQKQLSGKSSVLSTYEHELNQFFKSDYGVATSSGTAAIKTALFSVGVKAGDDVIVSSYVPSMSVFPILDIGANPIFCDINADNFGLSLDSIKERKTEKTKAIIEVPVFGYPTKVDKLTTFSEENNIPLILDLAQAHGAKLNGKYLNEYATISCFSTHDRKLLSTGEGGFVLTNNENLYLSSKKYIKFGNMNGVDYGMNYKLGALQASLGLNRIKYIKGQIKQKTAIAEKINENLSNPNISTYSGIEGGTPNYYMLLFYIKGRRGRDILNYFQNLGIPITNYKYNYEPLYRQKIFSAFTRKCKNAERLAEKIIALPVHQGMREKEIEYIITALNNF